VRLLGRRSEGIVTSATLTKIRFASAVLDLRIPA